MPLSQFIRDKLIGWSWHTLDASCRCGTCNAQVGAHRLQEEPQFEVNLGCGAWAIATECKIDFTPGSVPPVSMWISTSLDGQQWHSLFLVRCRAMPILMDLRDPYHKGGRPYPYIQRAGSIGFVLNTSGSVFGYMLISAQIHGQAVVVQQVRLWAQQSCPRRLPVKSKFLTIRGLQSGDFIASLVCA